MIVTTSPKSWCAAPRDPGGRKAPLPVVVRGELGELLADEQFAAAFGVRGNPGWSPGRLALIRHQPRARAADPGAAP